MSRFVLWTALPVCVPGTVAGYFSPDWGLVLLVVAMAANLAGYAEARRFSP